MRYDIYTDQAVTEVNLYQINKNTQLCYPDYLFLCILEGIIQLNTQGKRVSTASLQQQEIVLLPPGITLQICPTQNAVCLFLRLDPAVLLDALPDDRLFPSCLHSGQISELQNLIPDLAALARVCLTEAPTRTNQFISRLYAFLDRLETTLFSEPGASLSPIRQQTRQQEILSYIDRHIREPLSLHQTAEAIGITPQYLSAFFQKNYQCTFLHYLNHRKAERIYPWLLYTRLSDEDLANAAGFKSLSAFRKTLEDVFGKNTDLLRQSCRLPLYEKSPSFSNILHNYEYYFNRISYVPDSAAADTLYETTFHDIAVDFQNSMPDSWKSILNLGFARHISNAKLRAQITDFQGRHHFKYGRVLQLLQLTAITARNQHTRYEFDYVYHVLDFLLENGLTPFLDLGDKYYKYSPRFNEMQFVITAEPSKTHFDTLLAMLPEFIRACCNRYGKQEVSTWYFEVFYNIASYTDYEQGISFWKYLEYYVKIEQTLHAYLPDCHVGGSGFNTYDIRSHWETFFQSIRQQKVRMDFISIYTYGTLFVNDTPCVSRSPDLPIRQALKALRMIRGFFPETPVYITEFNYCHTSRNYLNDSVFHCNYITQYLIEVMELADGIGYYLLSDISLIDTDIEMNDMLFGGNGLYNYYGIHKPAFYAFYFFEQLGKYILGRGRNFLITANTRSQFQGVFFNFAELTERASFSDHNKELLTTPEFCFEQASDKTLHFSLDGAAPGVYMVKNYRINLHAGNLLASWVKCGYINELPKKSTEFFIYFSNPAADLYTIQVSEGRPLSFTVRMIPLEIQLLLIDCVEECS